MNDKKISKKKILVLIAVCCALICAAIALTLIFMDNKDNDKVDVTPTPVAVIRLTATEITDYNNGNVTSSITGIYSGENSTMNIYENGVVIGYDATAVFTAEKLRLNLIDIDNVNIDDYKSEVEQVYNISFEEANKFIATKISNGEVKLRTVETPTYCEVYTEKSGVITRHIITSNKLIIGTYYNTILPDVTHYFNYVASTVEK